MVRRLRSTLGIAVTLAIVVASVAFAIIYTWSTPAVVGGANQFATWMNGVHQVGVTVDATVTPNKTYTHYVYQSDYALDGTFTNDTKCANQNDRSATTTSGAPTAGSPGTVPSCCPPRTGPPSTAPPSR